MTISSDSAAGHLPHDLIDRFVDIAMLTGHLYPVCSFGQPTRYYALAQGQLRSHRGNSYSHYRNTILASRDMQPSSQGGHQEAYSNLRPHAVPSSADASFFFFAGTMIGVSGKEKQR